LTVFSIAETLENCLNSFVAMVETAWIDSEYDQLSGRCPCDPLPPPARMAGETTGMVFAAVLRFAVYDN
jgi:hypothetical protein